jgi:WD40-like Beta Propeller Repeat
MHQRVLIVTLLTVLWAGCNCSDRPLEIQQQPQDLSVTDGSTASFSVRAVGTGSLTYQWSRGGAALPEATSASYSFSASLSDDGSEVQVTVSDSLTSLSSRAARLSVTSAEMPAPAPTLTALTPDSALAGSPALTVLATGTNFVARSVLTWNGQPRPTTVLDATRLTAVLGAADLAVSAMVPVAVVTSGPGGGTSATRPFAVRSPPMAGVLFVVSADDAGVPGNGSSFDPSISADGRYVAFKSLASNLAPGDTNASGDVFLRDTCLGAPSPCLPSTVRVSLAADGGQLANGAVVNADIGAPRLLGADGRVLFLAKAGDLLPNSQVPSFTTELFIRVTCMGAASPCQPSTTLVSANAAGQPATSAVYNASLSGNGRVAAYVTGSNNLVSAQLVAPSAVATDSCHAAPADCVPTTVLISAAPDGGANNQGVRSLTVDFSGRFVAFQSGASNLVPGDSNGHADIFVRDTCLGTPADCVPTTVLVTATPSGAVSTAPTAFEPQFPSISGDGRYVLFMADPADLVSGARTGSPQVLLRDTCLGATGPCTASTSVVSASAAGVVGDSNGNVNGMSLLSQTGRFAAFSSFSTNLVPDVSTPESYVRDTCAGAGTGCQQTLHVVSADSQGMILPGVTNAPGSDGVPALSADGHTAVLMRFDHASNATQAYLVHTGF